MATPAARGPAARAPQTTTSAPVQRSDAPRRGVSASGVAAGVPVVPLASLRRAPVTEAPPTVRALLAQESGAALPPSVREALEHTLGVDLSAVRVHQSTRAAALVDDMGARAFALGPNVLLGSRERSTDLALLAHEVAHVVQQQGGPAIQRDDGAGQSGALEREADQVSTAAVQGQRASVEGRTSPKPQYSIGGWLKSKAKAVGGAIRDAAGAVKDFVVDIVGKVLNYIKEHVQDIPGYDLLGFILGFDPITQKNVDRTPMNLVRGIMGMVPTGKYIFEALQNHGIIQKVGSWLSAKLKELFSIVSDIGSAFKSFLGSLGPGDLLDLSGAWNRAKRIFSAPVERAFAFVKGLAFEILGFIRDAILLPIAKLAEGRPEYDLLKAVLGKDPITKQPVKADAEILIGGFMKLIGKEEIWENMKKARAVDRAFRWFKKAVSDLIAILQEIPGRFLAAFKSLEIMDLIVVTRAFGKIFGVFGNVLLQIGKWAGNAAWNLLEIIFDVVSPGAFDYIKKTGAALKSILKNPLPFVRNLVKAAKLGFDLFGEHFGEHLKKGLIDWLLGAMPGIYIPKAFELGEIVKFVFSVLGISWANVRAKLVTVLGDTVVQAMEAGFDIVVTLVTEGPAAAWDKIKEQLGNLQEMVINGIVGMVVDMIVQKAIPKLIAMFIPGAGFISAIISIYDTIMVFVKKIAAIVQVVKGFVDSIVNIAAGQIDGAAKKVETTLAGLLSLAISFFAGFAGLGNVADKIMGVIKVLQAKVDAALDAIVAWIVTMAKKMFGAVKKGVKKLLQWWKKEVPLEAGGEKHTLKFDGAEGSASLGVHSKKKSVPGFVQDFVAVKGTAGEIAKANKADVEITAIQKKLVKAKEKPDEPLFEALATELATKLDALGEILKKLMNSSAEQGSANNPLQIDYPKRRASAYPDIFIGPKVGSGTRIPQDVLRPLANESHSAAKAALRKAPMKLDDDNEGFKAWKSGGVRRLSPIVANQNVDGSKVGLSENFASLAPGKLLGYTEKEGTGGGHKINDVFKPYGFVPSSKGGEGLDGDHVMERQLGGPDDLINLWPLPKSENRSAGSTLKSTKVSLKPGEEMTIHEAKVKLGKKTVLFLLLRSVKG